MASRQIKAGEGDLFIAGGVESMSRAPLVMPKADRAFSQQAEIYETSLGWRFINPKMEQMYGTDSMGETAENVAQEFNISREDQDAYALRSQQRTAAAIASGRLAKEICPVGIPQRKGDAVIVDTDEHPRPQTTLEALENLGTPFREGGTVTAGNCSGINDGAAALIIASESRRGKIRIDAAGKNNGRSKRWTRTQDHGLWSGPGHAKTCLADCSCPFRTSIYLSLMKLLPARYWPQHGHWVFPMMPTLSTPMVALLPWVIHWGHPVRA